VHVEQAEVGVNVGSQGRVAVAHGRLGGPQRHAALVQERPEGVSIRPCLAPGITN